MSSQQMYDVLKRLRELDAKNPNVVTDAIDNTTRMNGSVNEAPLTRQQSDAMRARAASAFDELDAATSNSPQARSQAQATPQARSQSTAQAPTGRFARLIGKKVFGSGEIVDIADDLKRITFKTPTGRNQTIPFPQEMTINGQKINFNNAQEYLKWNLDQGNFESIEHESVEEGKKAKPDYLDFDKDGNKKEPMKKALKDKEKKKVDEAITITADSPEEAGMIARLMKLAGLQQVTPDMMPDGDGAPVMKAMPSIGGCGGGDYDNTPHEDVKGLESVTSQAGLDGVNGRKAPQDLRVKDPSDHADFTPRLKDLAGIHSDEVEEEWDNEPDEHYKSYDPDEYADKSDHATKNTRMVPARSGDNPMTAMEELEQQLMDAYQEFMSERELTQPEEDERERLVKGMKKAKGDFERRYGDRGEEVMYATATKMAKERR